MLNEFEMAILKSMASENQSLKLVTDSLRVRDRSYTPCGVYIDFFTSEVNRNFNSQEIGFCSGIKIPNISKGLQANLIGLNGYPATLEIVTLGGESWDGNYEGFEIETNT